MKQEQCVIKLTTTPEIRDTFERVANTANETPGKILNELLLAYLQKMEQPLISDEERWKRESATSFAQANVELEGFYLDEATKELNRRFNSGEIDLDTYIKEGLNVTYIKEGLNV